MSLENTHYGYLKIAEMLKNCRSLFFIGIGGISMSALAEISVAAGYLVGGSDHSENAQTLALKKKGVPVFSKHDEANISYYDAVIYTVAIGADNPEYLAAKKAGKPLISRADYLGYLMVSYRHRIGVAGMHGKSTSTAMCAQIFLEGADPTVLCGAELAALQNSTCCIGGEREHFVFEACEYMDSFLDFNPNLAVILNIGLDHVDYFHGMDQIRDSFLRFAERTGEDGMVLYNADDQECIKTLSAYKGKKKSFGIDCPADFSACDLTHDGRLTEFDFCQNGSFICRVRLHLFGKHNVYNALAAASAASLCGMTPDCISSALESFTGAKRRMEHRGEKNGAVYYEDYAHHPDEIRATLSGAREMGYSRILCAFQPHTYSRTAGLLQEFAVAFQNADRVYLADIYAAREQNIYGVDSDQLATKIGEKAEYCGSFASVAQALERDAAQGDLVIVMGAGDIYQVFPLLEI